DAELSRSTPNQPLDPCKTGPQLLSVHSPSRNTPPGAGACPAKASARYLCCSARIFTVNRSGLASAKPLSSSISPKTYAGSPSAMSSDDTVRPTLSRPVPAAQTVTGAASRPRRRRTASRSPSGGINGWSSWIVTPIPSSAPGSPGSRSQQGPEYVLHDAAVSVILGFAGGVDPHDGIELGACSVGGRRGDVDRLGDRIIERANTGDIERLLPG